MNAHGNSTREDDAIEAQAIRDTLGDVPVTAPKSFFGNLGHGSGMVELVISVLAMRHGVVPPTLNYQTPDPECPVNVATELIPTDRPAFMALNHNTTGQAAAVVIAALYADGGEEGEKRTSQQCGLLPVSLSPTLPL